MRRAIFLDDGGVLNDNARRGPQWQRLVGEFFAPRLGGEPECLGAQRTATSFGPLLDRLTLSARSRPRPSVLPLTWREYEYDWLALMCRRRGRRGAAAG